MSETLSRHRPSIDLDEFERRLHEQSASRHHEEDPLAELARLVGEQHDPYGDVFAQEAVAHPQAAVSDYHAPDLHQADGRREPAFAGLPRFPADFAAIEAGLRGAIPAHAEPQFEHPQFQHAQFHDQESQDLHAQDLHAQDPHAYAAEAHDQQPEHGYAAAPEAEWRQPQRESRTRKPVYAMVATIAIGVVGIGVAFAYKGTSSSPREIKTIMAAAGPTKIQPPADQSADQAGADAGAQQTPTKLVSREEQPVDLPQAVQDNAARDAAARKTDADSVPVPLSPAQQQDVSTGAISPDYSALGGGGDAAPQAQPMPASGTPLGNANERDGFGVGMGRPKKVKVVSVRPDGTILSDAAPAEADTLPPSVKPNDRAEPQTSTPRTLPPKIAPKIGAKPAKATSRVAVAAPPPDDGADAAAAPKPVKGAHKPKPVRVATNDTGEQEATEAAAPPASGGGGFAVQLAAPGSEAEAKAATSRFLKKFGEALHGRRLGFHRAESNGKTVYRVRVSSLSKEDATSLCGKLKADGGTCFIAKN